MTAKIILINVPSFWVLSVRRMHIVGCVIASQFHAQYCVGARAPDVWCRTVVTSVEYDGGDTYKCITWRINPKKMPDLICLLSRNGEILHCVCVHKGGHTTQWALTLFAARWGSIEEKRPAIYGLQRYSNFFEVVLITFYYPKTVFKRLPSCTV